MSVTPISAPRTYRVMYGALPAKRTSTLPLWMVFLVPLIAVLLPIVAAAQSVIEHGFGDGFLAISILAIGTGLVIGGLILASPKGARK